jgi:hypothetical protein
MKKLIFLLPIFVIFFLYSCEKQPVTTVTTVTTKTTLTEPGTNGFLISQEIVVRGNTVWGFSRESYGTGLQWRDIVAQNPFLQQPGRVYYNKDRKMWIVKIHVGEVVKIGNSIITPSCIVEESTTTTTKTTPAPEFFPWWGWLLIAFFAVGFLCLIFRHGTNNSSSAIVNVDMGGLGIDMATRVALLGREQDFRDNTLKVIQSASDKDALSHFDIGLDSENFYVSVDYKEKVINKKETKNDSKKEEEK